MGGRGNPPRSPQNGAVWMKSPRGWVWVPSPRACVPGGARGAWGGERPGRAGLRYYHPLGRKVAARVAEGLKILQEQIAEACGRCWDAQPGPLQATNQPPVQAQGGGLREPRPPGLRHQPVLREGEREAARQSPTFCGPLSLCPRLLPQWLGAEECSCQDEVEEEEAQRSPGMQSPQHGENHHLFRSLSPGFCLPLSLAEGRNCCPLPGPPHKGRGSRARPGQKRPPEL